MNKRVTNRQGRGVQGWGGALTSLSSRVPRAGVTSFMATTVSSTGGMLAPVPWALTCTMRAGMGGMVVRDGW